MKILGAAITAILLFWHRPAAAQTEAVVGQRVPCLQGQAAGYTCSNVDLLSFLPIAGMGDATVTVDSEVRPVRLNDIWGWTDRETGREYALVGRTDGTSFVDISDPVSPVFIGFLPAHAPAVGDGHDHLEVAQPASPAGDRHYNVRGSLSGASTWRDIKVLGNHAVVVADASPGHGMQIFDLSQLRTVTNPPVIFEETALYDGIGSAHNVVANEATNTAFVVGGRGGNQPDCGGGLHMVDMTDPLDPLFVGCYADTTTGRASTGYTHDAQCVIYSGPDTDYVGREICIGSNETAISIADVTDRQAPRNVASASYPDVGYVHQGWLTPDQRHFYQNDETDEVNLGREDPTVRTRTIIWDLTNLDRPQVLGIYHGTTQAIDHNLYVVGDRMYQANYSAGLRIIDISDVARPEEIGFFDTHRPTNGRGFDGAWSSYPFFESGVVIVSSKGEGLFVLDPTGVAEVASEVEALPGSGMLQSLYPNPVTREATIVVDLEAAAYLDVEVHDVLGRRVSTVHSGMLAAGRHVLTLDATGLANGPYLVRATGAGKTLFTGFVVQR